MKINSIKFGDRLFRVYNPSKDVVLYIRNSEDLEARTNSAISEFVVVAVSGMLNSDGTILEPGVVVVSPDRLVRKGGFERHDLGDSDMHYFSEKILSEENFYSTREEAAEFYRAQVLEIKESVLKSLTEADY